ncbi:unnamed protein product [Oppiella nova]|uniref:Uncharacterized protein n=1 Tax=Oppiella nova TaxID=334625 RepID=A0A7R9QM25_9ACAR|nr:unnamed protein product [Oppiella nova]CAG2167717.1 unnamed protein product [Oppiella nova]
MSSKSSQKTFRGEDEEEDEEMLRRAALKSMAVRDKSKATADVKKRTNNAIKSNNYFKNSHRNNGSKHSNLIVLTKNEPQIADSQTTSHSKSFTKIVDKTSTDGSKGGEHKGSVGPERFSRYERNDSDDESDEDSDECCEDKHSMTTTTTTNEINDKNITNADMNCETIDETIVCNDISKSDNNNELNCDSNRQTNYNKELFDNSDVTSGREDICDKKETKERIKLSASSDVSKTSVLERRKQKFGSSVSVTEDSLSEDKSSGNSDLFENNSPMNANRVSVKSRLSDNCGQKQRFYSKNCRHNSNDSISSNKEIESRVRHHPNARHERQMDSNDDFRDCDSSSSKKRLRSLVVMK